MGSASSVCNFCLLPFTCWAFAFHVSSDVQAALIWHCRGCCWRWSVVLISKGLHVSVTVIMLEQKVCGRALAKKSIRSMSEVLYERGTRTRCMARKASRLCSRQQSATQTRFLLASPSPCPVRWGTLKFIPTCQSGRPAWVT